MRRPMIAPFAGNASSSQFDRLVGHLRFFEASLLGDALDDVSITVSSRKFHRAISVLRVQAQYLLDNAHGFDEFAPVDRA